MTNNTAQPWLDRERRLAVALLCTMGALALTTWKGTK